MYSEFAYWYDDMMHTVDYDSWASYLELFLREHNCMSVLECGCGTGSISVRLARKGFSMTASDISEDMLMVARNKMLKAGLRFPIIRQDMRELKIHNRVDCIISACDGVNYLLDGAELFFQSAFNALKPGGILLFDISSEFKLSNILNNKSFSDLDENWAYICDCEYEKLSSQLKMYLTCFVKAGSSYKRFEECHVQCSYSEKQITDMLKRAHFENICCFEHLTFSLPEAKTERIQFIAVKPNTNLED